ncbi:hypothetical protein GCM10027423_06210 [Spirosoma arcticum]
MWAQLSVSYPLPHMVIQRDRQNQAPLYIAGFFSLPVDRVEARLVRLSSVPNQAADNRPADWMLVQDRPRNGQFRGVLTAPAGFFRLDVRGVRDNQTVSTTSVTQVGVGEVFLVAGQSNAMGIPKLGAKSATDRVVSFNAWNRFWNKNDVFESSDNPFPHPTFSPLAATNLMFPTGETAWCWGELGDHIADRYNVPVAFFNVAMPATVAENWSSTANGKTAVNIFVSKPWPFLQPYSNLRNALQYYHNLFGIRAVLWHHGESDAVPLRTEQADYRRYVQETIDHSRADFGRNLTWVVAQCSISPKGPVSSMAVVGAQVQLAQLPGNNVWLGPNTDVIQSPRPEHGHFENIAGGIQGISTVADAWNRNLTSAFFEQSQPHQPRQFIQTGLVPSEIPVGTEVAVPFETLGFTAPSPVVIQLLNERGWYVSEVGKGWTNAPLRVKLPDTLSTGLYRLRVVATAPVLAGVPSLPFRATASWRDIRPFIDVQSERIDSTVQVYWLSAQEPPNSRFSIERRDDAGNFQPVGSLVAPTDGQLSHLYAFKDPVARSGENVYRIRLESPNGRVQFSNDNALILALPNEPVPAPVIYPNPNDGRSLTVRLPRSGVWNYQLRDLTGRLVWQQTVSATANQPQTTPLPPTLTNGLYMLHLLRDGQHHAQRLLIKKN